MAKKISINGRRRGLFCSICRDVTRIAPDHHPHSRGEHGSTVAVVGASDRRKRRWRTAQTSVLDTGTGLLLAGARPPRLFLLPLALHRWPLPPGRAAENAWIQGRWCCGDGAGGGRTTTAIPLLGGPTATGFRCVCARRRWRHRRRLSLLDAIEQPPRPLYQDSDRGIKLSTCRVHFDF